MLQTPLIVTINHGLSIYLRKARGLAINQEIIAEIYRTTTTYPDSEKFGLSNQMRRAVVSVASNIAEGSTRISKKEQARFTEVAFGSMTELVCQMTLSADLGFIDVNKYNTLRNDAERITRMLNGLRKHQLGH